MDQSSKKKKNFYRQRRYFKMASCRKAKTLFFIKILDQEALWNIRLGRNVKTYMSRRIQIEVGKEKGGMVDQHNGSGLDQQRPSKKITVTPIKKEKIQYEFKFILHAYPDDFSIIKESLEEWMSHWD